MYLDMAAFECLSGYLSESRVFILGVIDSAGSSVKFMEMSDSEVLLLVL